MDSYGFECKRCGERGQLPLVADADMDIVRAAFLRQHAEACFPEGGDGIGSKEPSDGSEGEH